MLVGREGELALITRVLVDARLGRSRVLVLRGDAGVGKTALLDRAVAEADGFLVLRSTGSEAEVDLPFAGLHALLRPVLDLIAATPPAQARALRGALALEEVEPERLAVFAGTLSLLAAAADRRPLLVAIDDAHWLDRASAEALAFAARRVAGEAVALVFASRSGETAGAIFAGFDEIELAPLSDPAALELLRARPGPPLGRGVARRIASAARGNPLALLEIPTLLTDRQRAGLDPLGEVLPVTESVERSVRRRLGSLPATTRHWLLLAAAGAPRSDLADPDLLVAEERGLLHVHDGAVRFQHPLVSAAIYGQASPAERRAVHREIAASLTDELDADRRAWHLAAASDGPDEAVAEALEAAADRARARGGFAAQAQALTRAGDLSLDDAARARRLLTAATAAYWSGDAALAMSLAERALPQASDPLLHAAVIHRLAIIADWHGQWRDRVVSTETLERVAAEIEPLDPRLAVGLLGVDLQRRFQALETREALALAERRLALCRPEGDERHLRATQDLARAAGLHGDARRCAALCDQILDRSRSSGTIGFATNIAEPLLWLERYEECRQMLVASVDDARQQGNFVRLTFELTNLGLLELRTGSFMRALATASEAAELASDSGNDYLQACNLAVLARLAGARGDGAACHEQAGRAAAIADRLGDELIGAEVRMATAELALAEGRPADAVALLDPVRQLAERNEIGELGVLPFWPDLIEALARSGYDDEARAGVERFEAQARRLDRRWALAAAARCRGFVGPVHELDDHFRAALDLHVVARWSPFELARTHLLYGERLRRARRRVDARVPLRAAIDTFDRLGAAPWSERARLELAATGQTIPRRDRTAPEMLTAQELQVCLQVAEGRTNREVAEVLFLSPKTVEFHLSRVYRKLDINSRAQLIRLLVADGGLERSPVAGLHRPAAT